MFVLLYIVSCFFFQVSPQYLSEFTIPADNCSCGLDLNFRGRIFGGVEAEEAEFPWQAAFYNLDRFFCGGSLINSRYIVSASHCFRLIDLSFHKTYDIPVENVTIILGGYHLGRLSKILERDPTTSLHYPLNITVHPDFDPVTFRYDISIIKLRDEITVYTTKILPICLPPPGLSFEGEVVTVSGWGSQTRDTGPVETLRKTNVKIMSHLECKLKLLHHYYPELMMCAASIGHDACHGDSGGPLMLMVDQRKYILVGLVSFGIGCGDYNRPGAYTRVNSFLDFIKEQTKGGLYCAY